jgi:hypothetical protein
MTEKFIITHRWRSQDHTQEELEFRKTLERIKAQDIFTPLVASDRIKVIARLNTQAQAHLILSGCELVSYERLMSELLLHAYKTQ